MQASARLPNRASPGHFSYRKLKFSELIRRLPKSVIKTKLIGDNNGYLSGAISKLSHV